MKDMTVGNPVKLILFFSVPLILANICQQCYNLADTFVVGRYLGKAALAAVGGASGTLIFAIFGFFFGLSGGLAVITAQKFGAKDYAAVKKSIASSLVLCAAISLPPLLGAGFFARELLVLMNTPGDVIDNAEKYLQILFFLGLPNILHTMLNSTLRSLGDSKTPLYFMALSNFINIGLNFYLVLVAGWGVAGVAWATVIAQIISAVLFYIWVIKKNSFMKLSASDWIPDWKFYLEHLKIGLPMGFQFAVNTIGILVIQRVFNGFGSDAVGGISAVQPLNSVTFMPLFSIGISVATFVAQNYGAGKLDRIRSGTANTMTISFIYTAVTSVIMVIFARESVMLFLENTPDNAEAIAAGSRFLQIQAMFYTILSVLLVFRNVLQGMGYPFMPFMAGVSEMVLRVLVAIFFTGWFGFDGVCLAHPIAWLGGALPLVIEYFRIIKRLKKSGIPVKKPTAA